MNEVWKKIEYPSVPKDIKHYEVSNLGRVRRGSIIEPVTMEQNGDVTVVLLSLNGDYVSSDSTPPAKYVVADLLRDATTHKVRVFGFGVGAKVFVRPHERKQTEGCIIRRTHHPLESFQGFPLITSD